MVSIDLLTLPPEGVLLRVVLGTIERDLITQALDRADTRTAAANLLGITRTTLIEKMRRYGIPLNYHFRMTDPVRPAPNLEKRDAR